MLPQIQIAQSSQDYGITENSQGVFEHTENFLHQIAQFLEITLESIAIVIVALAVLQILPRLFHHYRRQRSRQSEVLSQQIRLELGLALGLALEFLLAADIVGTAITPSWAAIGQLAAIAAIRTFLNYFLTREIEQLKAEVKHEAEPKVASSGDERSS
jgi:uncharacterized membrane protein